MSTHSNTPKRSIAEALTHVTGEITRLLEQGVMPWRAPWDSARALAATPGLPLRSTGEPYRGANVVLLWSTQLARGYRRRTWLTFRQTLALGGHVRKGEKACPVVYYGQAQQGRTDEASAKAEDARSYRFLKFFYVFNAEQCAGLELSAEPELSSASDLPALRDWVARAGARIRIGGDKAFYAPSIDMICLPDVSAFANEAHWSSTLAHEVVHFTGHKSRLDRLSDYATDRRARAREEMTAEIGAAIIGAMTGLPPNHLEDHAAYLSDWLSLVRDEPRAFFSAAARAQAAVDWLINAAGHPADTSPAVSAIVA